MTRKRKSDHLKARLQSTALELKQEQADVLACFERDREIVEIPLGLESGKTMRRKRGARTDADCIFEICELISRGITATAATNFVAPSLGRLGTRACERTLILDQIEARRESKTTKYHAEHRAWRKACNPW